MRNVPIFCLLLTASLVYAQSSNGTYTLVQEVVSSGGGTIGGGNPMSAQTVLGLPIGGASANASVTLVGGIGEAHPPGIPLVTTKVTVTWTVADASAIARVRLNGQDVAVTGTDFSAELMLAIGPNRITVEATDAAGNAASQLITVYVDTPHAAPDAVTSVDVIGTLDDPNATVTVNGTPAVVTAGTQPAQWTFTASSVPLPLGKNVVEAIATDAAGNEQRHRILVFVMPPIQPPARPTVGTRGDPIPEVTAQTSVTLGGTKTAGTSIWINGKQVWALDDTLEWSATLNLIEGDNELTIVAKDLVGTESASAVVIIVLDLLPPVVTFDPPLPTKTNWNPFLLRGRLDDHLTTVTVNKIAATHNKRDFEVAVPLVYGPGNALHLIAVGPAPNRFTTTEDYVMELGTVPQITTIQPADATKLYAGVPLTIQIDATDKENDPIEYRVLLDGAALKAWSPDKTFVWTPSLDQLGLHTLTLNARDAFGDEAAEQPEVFVIRQPVQPQ